MSQYLAFIEVGVSQSGKTKIWDMINKNHGDNMGLVHWYGRWRQYTYNIDDLEFSASCLRDIADFLDEKMKEHREGRK